MEAGSKLNKACTFIRQLRIIVGSELEKTSDLFFWAHINSFCQKRKMLVAFLETFETMIKVMFFSPILQDRLGHIDFSVLVA